MCLLFLISLIKGANETRQINNTTTTEQEVKNESSPRAEPTLSRFLPRVFHVFEDFCSHFKRWIETHNIPTCATLQELIESQHKMMRRERPIGFASESQLAHLHDEDLGKFRNMSN